MNKKVLGLVLAMGLPLCGAAKKAEMATGFSVTFRNTDEQPVALTINGPGLNETRSINGNGSYMVTLPEQKNYKISAKGSGLTSGDYNLYPRHQGGTVNILRSKRFMGFSKGERLAFASKGRKVGVRRFFMKDHPENPNTKTTKKAATKTK